MTEERHLLLYGKCEQAFTEVLNEKYQLYYYSSLENVAITEQQRNYSDIPNIFFLQKVLVFTLIFGCKPVVFLANFGPCIKYGGEAGGWGVQGVPHHQL